MEGLMAGDPKEVAAFQVQYEKFTADTYPKLAKLIARAWADPAYEKQLKADPTGEMRKAGIPLPAGFQVTSEEFVIAPKPVGIGVESLRGMATTGFSTGGTAS